MTDSPNRAESIFAGAAALASAAARAAYLDEACAGDEALREQVEALLRAHERVGHMLDRPLAGDDEPTNAYIVCEEPGTVIAARYKLLEEIGEGGMGTVWVAEQTQPVRRKVALKLIKPGMDSKSVLARFEAERQALAMMDHPNIAKVLDGGLTETGRPYFVMEYVKGVPITEYCDATRLSVPERLDLFVQVCRAVQHAHQKGIIHRDLKPSNILVAPYDGRPVPKVIDFGLAKAMHQSLTERTLHTAHETVLGTPLYMSPEQAQLNNLDVDTRSDIYSLGVLLYELLTGTTPVEKKRFKEAAWDEIRRIIREEEPPKPSTRLSSTAKLAKLAAGRQSEPARLTKLVRGELDWIVMKAIEKDRSRRYETANAFGNDIQRFLAGEAVLAVPPSAGYRLRKFVRRHKASVIVTTLLAGAGLVAAGAGWFAFLGERQRNELAENVRRAEEARRREEQFQKIDFPIVERLVKQNHAVAAFQLARELRKTHADDPRLAELWNRLTEEATFRLEPLGTRVLIRDWDAGDDDWVEVGETPLLSVRVPKGDLRWKFEHPGWVTLETVNVADAHKWMAKRSNLWRASDAPPRMVFIIGTKAGGDVLEDVGRFFVDRFEVTNREFQRFVDAGGYSDQKHWATEFQRDGKSISWADAIKEFRDQTGQPGPALWSSGHYLPGEADYPVRGVSWYEADAFARFSGKRLPTIHHWGYAAAGKDEYILPLSNFSGRAPEPVGRNLGIGLFGTYDMAGNVKEWCSNEMEGHRRAIRGGAWSDANYMFRDMDSDAPMARPLNCGFRCVKYIEPPSERALAPYKHVVRDYDKEPAATPAELAAHLSHFAYDKSTPLDAKVPTTDLEPNAEYRHEVVQINAAYGSERFDVHLYFPRHGQTPFETVVEFPGIGAMKMRDFASHTNGWEGTIEQALVRTGRAVCIPIYQGTFERLSPVEFDPATIRGRTWFIQFTQDLSRTVDYLATRSDIDSQRLSFAGLSLCACIGPVLMVAEPRFKAAVFVGGGYPADACLPEIDPRRYTPHMKLPVLMINGSYDTIFPVRSLQLPMFRHLGSADKQHKFLPSGHVVPAEKGVSIADEWLKSRLGADRPPSSK
jgi:serine/threonine protein kinase/formylglycine-generating enzyme required for sulfatase activity/dienelactone hydrolase